MRQDGYYRGLSASHCLPCNSLRGYCVHVRNFEFTISYLQGHCWSTKRVVMKLTSGLPIYRIALAWCQHGSKTGQVVGSSASHSVRTGFVGRS